MKGVLYCLLLFTLLGCKSEMSKSFHGFFHHINGAPPKVFSDWDPDSAMYLRIIDPESIGYIGFCGIISLDSVDADFFYRDSIKLSALTKLVVHDGDSLIFKIGEMNEIECVELIPILGLENKFAKLKQLGCNSETEFRVSDYSYSYRLKKKYSVKENEFCDKYRNGYSEGYVFLRSNKILRWAIYW